MEIGKSNVLSESEINEEKSKDYTIYIIRTADNKLYIGQTNDLNNRETTHKSNKRAEFLKHRDFV